MVRIYNNLHFLYTCVGHNSFLNLLEKKFAVGCGHRCICVCYFEESQCFWVAKHIKKQIRSTTLCLDWHPNNVLIAAGGSDFKCRIFVAYVLEVDGQQPQPTPWGTSLKPADCIAEFTASNHGWVHSCAFNLSAKTSAHNCQPNFN